VFDSVQRTTGREYTRTVAWLAIAIIFIPAVFLGVRPHYISLSVAFVCIAICVTMAWISWKKSRLTMPSIAPRKAVSK
jgi:undecaprenyl pyrophosphate phosphatase UppP